MRLTLRSALRFFSFIFKQHSQFGTDNAASETISYQSDSLHTSCLHCLFLVRDISDVVTLCFVTTMKSDQLCKYINSSLKSLTIYPHITSNDNKYSWPIIYKDTFNPIHKNRNSIWVNKAHSIIASMILEIPTHIFAKWWYRINLISYLLNVYLC